MKRASHRLKSPNSAFRHFGLSRSPFERFCPFLPSFLPSQLAEVSNKKAENDCATGGTAVASLARSLSLVLPSQNAVVVVVSSERASSAALPPPNGQKMTEAVGKNYPSEKAAALSLSIARPPASFQLFAMFSTLQGQSVDQHEGFRRALLAPRISKLLIELLRSGSWLSQSAERRTSVRVRQQAACKRIRF